MILSDVFKIITNMDIFQHDELSKTANLKSSQCRNRKKRKVSKMSFKKIDIDEKPNQHKRMKKNILVLKKKVKNESPELHQGCGPASRAG